MTAKALVLEDNNMCVVIRDIIMVVANHLHLPRERGYKIEIIDRPDPYLKMVSVTSKEWGQGSLLTLGLEYDPAVQFWFPTSDRMELFLGNHDAVPEEIRGYGFILEVRRRPSDDSRQWRRGPYPRYTVRRISSQRLRHTKVRDND